MDTDSALAESGFDHTGKRYDAIAFRVGRGSASTVAGSSNTTATSHGKFLITQP